MERSVKYLRVFAVIFCCAALATVGISRFSFTAEEDAAAKQRDIRKLVEMCMPDDVRALMTDHWIALYKKSFPNVPAEYWEETKKTISLEQRIDLAVEIYSKNISHDDIKEMLTFYDSPAGKRIAAALPIIAKEFTIERIQRDAKTNEIIMKKLMDDGYYK